MRIHRVIIKNFRNFHHLDVCLGEHAVIVGENKIGKSNFLFALRLVLDSSLSDASRMLQASDFWEGLGQPVPEDVSIHITVELVDFQHSNDLKAALCDCLISVDPLVARLNYVFRPVLRDVHESTTPPQYEFLLHGGDEESRLLGYRHRHWMPFDLLQALRDSEHDLLSFRRSPLQPLLKRAFDNIPQDELQRIAEAIGQAQEGLTTNEHIRALDDRIHALLTAMTGDFHAIDTTLQVASTRPDALFRAIRLHIDRGIRDISQASLGSANLLYIALKTLEIQQALDSGERHHSFFAIEEPEAHLHPHVQRLAYKHFLLPRYRKPDSQPHPSRQTILMTTHSPHIVSITPLRSLVLLKHDPRDNATIAVSTANIPWTDQEVADLERYLEVTRGEILFARAVLLVEGDAEEYIIPAFARLLNCDFDERGISVCSVSGTHFQSYIKLLGPQGLDIPFAIITDYDPRENDDSDKSLPPLSLNRVRKLIKLLSPHDDRSLVSEAECFQRGQELGIFVNNHTLEVDLFRAGAHSPICETLIELSDNSAVQGRATGWQKDPSTIDIKALLNDINGISKGRFAQSLAGRLAAEYCPDYIQKAIRYLAGGSNA